MCHGFTAKAWLCSCWALHGLSADWRTRGRCCIEVCFHGLRWGCIHFFLSPFFCVYFVVVCSRPVGVTEAQASSGCGAGTQGSELQSACPSALVPAVPCHPSLSLCHSLTVADSPTEGAALHLCWMRLLIWIGIDEAFGINPCQNFLLWKFNHFMT